MHTPKKMDYCRNLRAGGEGRDRRPPPNTTSSRGTARKGDGRRGHGSPLPTGPKKEYTQNVPLHCTPEGLCQTRRRAPAKLVFTKRVYTKSVPLRCTPEGLCHTKISSPAELVCTRRQKNTHNMCHCTAHPRVCATIAVDLYGGP